MWFIFFKNTRHKYIIINKKYNFSIMAPVIYHNIISHLCYTSHHSQNVPNENKIIYKVVGNSKY